MRQPVGKSGSQLDPLWYIAQGYGNPTSYGFHDGNDYNLRTGGDSDLGQNLYAIANGTVTSIHKHITQNTFGEHFHIQHDGAWGTVYSHYAHCQSIAVAVGDVVKEGQIIGKLGKSGTDVAHLHFAIKNQPTGVDSVPHTKTDLLKWEDPTKFIEKWSSNMADTVAVERAKFEELVTKATKYDDIVKTGVTMASDIDNLKRQIKEANSQVGAAQEEATNTRKTLTEFQQQVADKLNSPQDLARILSAIQGLLDSEAQAVKNSEKDAFKLKEAEGAILELKAEIARLQLELKANKSLATATMLQMFTEIIERFKRILNGL